MRTQLNLEYDLIAVESEDTVHALLELTAPAPANAHERPPATLQVVIDRSGSIADGRLFAALQALDALIGRLQPNDRLGLVTFDNEVNVPIAAGAVGDGSPARQALASVYPGGMTNLSGGLLRGIQEAQRAADGGGSTLVLLSDGHANEGITDHARLERFATGAQSERITSSTIGIGLGYDEDLLAAIARGGGGNASFAEQGDDAGAALASEVDDGPGARRRVKRADDHPFPGDEKLGEDRAPRRAVCEPLGHRLESLGRRLEDSPLDGGGHEALGRYAAACPNLDRRADRHRAAVRREGGLRGARRQVMDVDA